MAKLIASIVKDAVEVEDILQEAYIKTLVANRSQKIDAPKAFLTRTAKNLALNHIARSAVKFNISTEEKTTPTVYSDAPSVEEQLESDRKFKHFCDAVQGLPVQCRRVFVLRQVYGLSQKDIASRLNISEKTVEYHVGKGLFKCRKHMDSLNLNEMTSSADLQSQSEKIVRLKND